LEKWQFLSGTFFSAPCKIIHQTQPKFNYLNMMLRPQSEAFIRRSSVLPVLDRTGRCHVKKAVMGVSELIAALVPIHSMLAFLADMYCHFDPPGKSHRLPVDHHHFGPVDNMVLLSHVVGEGICCVLISWTHVCPAYQNTTNPPSPATWLKRIILSTGPKRW